MNKQEVKKKVKEIRQSVNDPESAHVKEDNLWYEVLEAIAGGKVEDPKELAKEALKTQKIKFFRWYA